LRQYYAEPIVNLSEAKDDIRIKFVILNAVVGRIPFLNPASLLKNSGYYRMLCHFAQDKIRIISVILNAVKNLLVRLSKSFVSLKMTKFSDCAGLLTEHRLSP